MTTGQNMTVMETFVLGVVRPVTGAGLVPDWGTRYKAWKCEYSSNAIEFLIDFSYHLQSSFAGDSGLENTRAGRNVVT
jgi:hypothetical protein